METIDSSNNLTQNSQDINYKVKILLQNIGFTRKKEQFIKILFKVTKNYKVLTKDQMFSLKLLLSYLQTLLGKNSINNLGIYSDINEILKLYVRKSGNQLKQIQNYKHNQCQGLKQIVQLINHSLEKNYRYPKIKIQEKCKQIRQGISKIPYNHLCCCSFLYQGWKIMKDKKSIIVVEQNIFQDEKLLQKMICAAANETYGAYIVSGVDFKNMKAIGIKISQGHKKYFNDRVIDVKKYLIPQLNDQLITVQFIPVLNDPYLSYCDQSAQKGRYVIMINVKPKLKTLYYIRYTQSKFQSFEYKDEKVKQIIGEQIYKAIHVRMNKRVKLNNRNNYEQCNSECNKISIKHEKIIDKSQEQLMKQKKYSNFPYRYNYVWIKVKNQRQNQLKNMLEYRNVRFKLTYCYEQLQKLNHDKKIYLLSTEIMFQKFNNFDIFKISTLLKVKQQIFQRMFQQYQQKFLNQFGKQIIYQKQQDNIYIQFNTQQQTLFSYIIFRRHGRPQLIRTQIK